MDSLVPFCILFKGNRALKPLEESQCLHIEVIFDSNTFTLKLNLVKNIFLKF